MRTSRAATAILGGSLLALVAVVTVFGYAGQVAATVEVSFAGGPQACGTPLTVSATIQDVDGALIEGQPVTWSFASGSVSGDRILTATSTTNANGVASTKVQFACSPHTVTVQALADAATGTVVITTTGQGLPRTDTAPSSSPAMLLAALAVVVGMGMVLRRFAADRR
jgi:hypothetical protein